MNEENLQTAKTLRDVVKHLSIANSGLIILKYGEVTEYIYGLIDGLKDEIRRLTETNIED